MDETATLAELASEEPATASASSPTVLRIGPWHLPEFTTAMATIDEANSWSTFENCEQVEQLLTGAAMPPDLLLWAQPLPGSVRQSQVDRLLQLAPLMRIVVVAGTWCEGEMRTGNPPTGVIRLYWYELAPWWHRASAQLSEGTAPAWSAPLTAQLAGRYLAETDTAPAPPAAPIVVASPDFAVYEALASTVVGKFNSCLWWRSNPTDDLPVRVSAGIWDGAQLDSEELVRFQKFANAIRERSGLVVALLDFPRAEHFAMLPGVTILGKPYIVEELQAACGLSFMAPLPGLPGRG